MYNIRYHIASLVSVFLALALGLVLGGLVVESTPKSGQDVLVTSLTDEFKQIRAESALLAVDTKNYTQFSEALTAGAVANQLSGKSVLVLGTKNSAYDRAIADVKSTGATPVGVVIKVTKLDAMDDAFVSKPLIAQIQTDTGAGTVTAAVASGLYKEWTSTDTSAVRPLTEALVKDGVLVMPKGYEKLGQMTGVINTSLNGEKVDELALALTKTFSSASYPAIGVSMFHGNTTLALASWENGISATNMLGSPIGTYTVVAVLRGAEPALYGSIEGASELYPLMPAAAIVPPADTTKSGSKEAPAVK